MASTGDNIEVGIGEWTFGKGVHKVFNTHINKSVPGYNFAHQTILWLSDPFITKGSKVLDIGCTTGTLLFDLAQRHVPKKPHFLGIDIEEEMINHCNEKIKKMNSEINLEFMQSDITTLELKENNYDLISMVFCLQFIHPKFRQNIIDSIFKSLNWGGAFFFFEKVRGPDARFQDYFTHSYNQYKLTNFNSNEILSKSASLTGVMEPFSSEGNHGLLKRAGFKDTAIVFKSLCFEGILAIK